MLSAVALGDPGRRRRLVFRAAGKFGKRQGDGADVVLAGIAHQADQGAGVDTGGQEGPDRDIRDQMMAHAVPQGRF